MNALASILLLIYQSSHLLCLIPSCFWISDPLQDSFAFPPFPVCY